MFEFIRFSEVISKRSAAINMKRTDTSYIISLPTLRFGSASTKLWEYLSEKPQK